MKMNTLLVFAVLGILILLSGCTQQNTTNTETTNSTNNTTDDSLGQSTDGTTDAMDDTTTDDTSDDATSTDTTPDAGTSIQTFATASPSNGYKADYDVKSTSPQGQEMESTMTMYGKYPQFRTDSIMTASGMTIESRSYYSVGGGEITVCSNFNGSWNCQTSEADDSTQAGAQASDPDIAFESDGTKMVAGETGTCFKGHRISEPEQTFNLCYTNDGILLYTFYDSGEGAKSELTATTVVRGIDNSVFTLPA